ncbi:hypothetical protein GCM10027294_42530 [Marinactinospora endophytica]
MSYRRGTAAPRTTFPAPRMIRGSVAAAAAATPVQDHGGEPVGTGRPHLLAPVRVPEHVYRDNAADTGVNAPAGRSPRGR